MPNPYRLSLCHLDDFMFQDFMSVEGWPRVQSPELQEKTKIYPQQESELTHTITFALSQFFKKKILKGLSKINFFKVCKFK
jgi:hypothetical protein